MKKEDKGCTSKSDEERGKNTSNIAKIAAKKKKQKREREKSIIQEGGGGDMIKQYTRQYLVQLHTQHMDKFS